jgi:RNA-directed DNA polymerase
VGRRFNPNWDDNSFSLENESETAGSTSIFFFGKKSGYANRAPSNQDKFFLQNKKKPTDWAASLPSNWHAGRFMNLYDRICSFENLLLAFHKARKGKTQKWYVKEFEKDTERNMLLLESELRNNNYKPQPMDIFIVRDPKTRKISAPVFRDRIVHHAINNILEPIFEKSFFYDSYASRKNKGMHVAIRRFDFFKRKATNNGKYAVYVLKADIRHYYDTVDHDVLVDILRKKISDEKIIALARMILKNSAGKGMPLGSLTSQLFANAYLNEMDKFVKHRLHAKFYIRYMDDFVILHRSRRVVEKWKNEIDAFLKTELKIELHPEKSMIYLLYRGVDFLGFRIFYHHKLLKKKSINRLRQRICNLIALYNEGETEKKEIMQRFEGWKAHAMHADTFRMRRRLEKKLKISLRLIDKERQTK